MRGVRNAFKSRWKNYVSDINDEFYGHIGEFLENDRVMQLDSLTHHHAVTRLRHSLDVAYISFVVARLLRWDSRSVARAALLHDLFYDKPRGYMHSHPAVALSNAREICELNKIEENIIRRHMWLITPIPPRYKEGYIVTMVDKFCALREVSSSLFHRSEPPQSVTANHA